jgi:hypothetical protein
MGSVKKKTEGLNQGFLKEYQTILSYSEGELAQKKSL